MTVTGSPSSGGAARLTNDRRELGSSKYEVTSDPRTNLVNRTRAGAPWPSRRPTSIRLARPAALCVGSGRSTRMLAGTTGPPAERGSSSRQPTLPKAAVRAAAAFGMTSSSGDSATLNPAG